MPCDASRPYRVQPNQAILHYHRPAADYAGWGLHVWGEVARDGFSWENPLPPSGEDAFGIYWIVELQPGATVVNFIIHQGDVKDPGPDQTLNLRTQGGEVWLASGSSEQYSDETVALSDIANQGLGDFQNRAEAHWLAVGSLAWPAGLPPEAVYRLHYDPHGSIRLVETELRGGQSIPLRWSGGSLPPVLAQRFPHLAQSSHLSLPSAHHAQVPELLKGQLVVSAHSTTGRLLRVAALQLPGVLDDLYAERACQQDLGVVWQGDIPSLRLWAPTARSVRLLLYPDADSPAFTVHPLELDPLSGVWQVSGEPGWEWQYYRYEVEVYVRQVGQVLCNRVTDPYSISLSQNSRRSQIVRLDNPRLTPPGWRELVLPPLEHPCDGVIYELHLRDFSACDQSVPPEQRGTYLAFTHPESHGMRHLRRLAQAGLTHIHLLPVFDIATIDEDKAHWQKIDFDLLSSYPPDSDQQQAVVQQARGKDGYNWGYDPYHFTTPEGSYSTDPDGPTRIFEFRCMVMALAAAGLRVVMDVVYNHTHAAGLSEYSVLDRVVPGYYHRLDANGKIVTSSCCPNTASEHAMMEKLLLDSLRTWASQYKIAGFRFDLMGHHTLANLERARALLDSLTPLAAGIEGRTILLYGEGWDFGELAGNARGKNACQRNLGGSGIGTFNDRMRDAARGGSPFTDPREQGFITGLYTDPSNAPVPDQAAQLAALLEHQDRLRLSLAGNLASYRLHTATGGILSGAELVYNDQPAGYTQNPQENVPYLSAHDNETLFDAIQLKAPPSTSLADRVRMHNLGLSLVALCQGLPFFDAGCELLRSKSFDRDSFDSGDWFNHIDWTRATNNFGIGLPLKDKNGSYWHLMRPLLANPELKPTPAHLEQALEHFVEMLHIRRSSALFRLRTAAEIIRQVHFPATGPAQLPGLIVMALTNPNQPQPGSPWQLVVVLFNADRKPITFSTAYLRHPRLSLHPLQKTSADPLVRTAFFDPAGPSFFVPARTTAVFVGSGSLQSTL